jgi:hypothetical protein
METESLRFDEDQASVNFGDLIEFDEIDDTDGDPEVLELMSRAHAARLAGA